MLELFQREGCPECARVRMKLSELMLDFVTRQVPAGPGETGHTQESSDPPEIPMLVDPERGMVVTEAGDIIAYLDENFGRQDMVLPETPHSDP